MGRKASSQYPEHAKCRWSEIRHLPLPRPNAESTRAVRPYQRLSFGFDQALGQASYINPFIRRGCSALQRLPPREKRAPSSYFSFPETAPRASLRACVPASCRKQCAASFRPCRRALAQRTAVPVLLRTGSVVAYIVKPPGGAGLDCDPLSGMIPHSSPA